MKIFLAAGFILSALAAPSFSFEGAALPSIAAMLQGGAVPVADTGDGAFQDPFAQAAKKTIYGRLNLDGGTKLEWDSRDYKTSAASAVNARSGMGTGIHDMADVLKKAGPGAWVILRDAKSGDSYYVFSGKNDDGETIFPHAPISGATKREVIDDKLWLTFPNEEAGSYQLVRLVPDAKNATDRTFSFAGGKLLGEAEVKDPAELNLLLQQPGMADALHSMKRTKLNGDTSYADGISGWVAGEKQSLTLSQSEDGTLTVGLKSDGNSKYEISANKDGAELASVGE